jgi:hypothetical protein
MATCPLCRSDATLEFHHWDYDRDIGIELCRDCHNAVHGGADGRVAIQQNRAEYYGAENWHVPAIGNLAERDIKHLPESELNITQDLEFEVYWEYLKDRYNLPNEARIGALSKIKDSVEGDFKYAQHGWLTQGVQLS